MADPKRTITGIVPDTADGTAVITLTDGTVFKIDDLDAADEIYHGSTVVLSQAEDGGPWQAEIWCTGGEEPDYTLPALEVQLSQKAQAA